MAQANRDEQGRAAEGRAAAGSNATTALTWVVPLTRQSDSITDVLARLREAIRDVEVGTEIVIVDDAVGDRGLRANALRLNRPVPLVVRHPRRRGRGAAMQTGLLVASGKYVIALDPRAETPIEYAGALLERLSRGADLAVASRREAHDATPRGLLQRASRTAYMKLAHLMVPVDASDSSADLLALKRDAARAIARCARVAGECYAHEWLALARRLELRVDEIAVQWTDPAPDGERNRQNEVAMLAELWKLRRRLTDSRGVAAAEAGELLRETRFVRLDGAR